MLLLWQQWVGTWHSWQARERADQSEDRRRHSPEGCQLASDIHRLKATALAMSRLPLQLCLPLKPARKCRLTSSPLPVAIFLSFSQDE